MNSTRLLTRTRSDGNGLPGMATTQTRTALTNSPFRLPGQKRHRRHTDLTNLVYSVWGPTPRHRWTRSLRLEPKFGAGWVHEEETDVSETVAAHLGRLNEHGVMSAFLPSQMAGEPICTASLFRRRHRQFRKAMVEMGSYVL